MGWGNREQHNDGAGSTWKWAQRPGVKTQSESRQPHLSKLTCSCHEHNSGVIIIFFTLSLPFFFFFFSLTMPSPLFPISPFPFPVEPHPITLLVSESSRHTCHTNPSIITCPFQLIIPNRTPVHRPIITVSPSSKFYN